ncbi:RagB/SusD family nutrient uptake outer membrane protein [Shivajiella indica]|uniref:RagB/SusD family nutrient uptake outer membrane protein n=1 Tax=Shivajiella indica TaxID=872115 RepID=A0ABW5B6Q1_9BACT
MQTNKTNILIVTIISICLMACQEFLDSKPRLDLEVPESLDELLALLSAEQRMNQGALIDIIASDDFYHTREFIESQDNPLYFNAYKRLLTPDMYADAIQPEWTTLYTQIYTANFCLQQLELTTRTAENGSDWDFVKGFALFTRAYAYSELLKVFAAKPSPQTELQISIPLVLKADINTIEEFAPLGKVYSQIFMDLEEAAPLLPDTPGIRTRGSKSAVHALAARVYLSMNEFTKALKHIDESLKIDNTLMDFNSLNPALNFPVGLGSPEYVYYKFSGTYSQLNSNPEARIDTLLYRSYEENDLRKTVYFFINPAGNINFKGQFTGRSNYFTGLSVSESLLIKAECEARLGNMEAAFETLNTLLESRYMSGTFEPFNPSDFEDPLGFILWERRKELLFRGLRWSDLKRYLGDRKEFFPLKRVLDNQIIEMDRSPEAFVFPIPQEEFTNR